MEIKQESKKIRNCIMLSDIRHYLLLMIYHFSPALINFGRRTIFFFEEEDLRRWITLGTRALMVLILYLIHQNWMHTLLSYAVIHLVVFLLGKLLHAMSERGLLQLDDKVGTLIYAYEGCKSEEYKTISEEEGFGDFILYTGSIEAPMRKKCEDICIYPLNNTDGYYAYSKRKGDLEETGISVNEKLASVQFTKKFGVFTEKDQLMDSMIFLSPVLQMKMINTPELQHFKNIIIRNGVISADIKLGPRYPDSVDVFSWKPFLICCTERDIYYKELQKYENFVYNQMKKIDFIRG